MHVLNVDNIKNVTFYLSFIKLQYPGMYVFIASVSKDAFKMSQVMSWSKHF